MKTFSSWLGVLVLFGHSHCFAANGDIQRSRFRPHLEELSRLFPPGANDPETVGERALSQGGRGATLNIQGLTRIYKKLPDAFEEVGDAVKTFGTAVKELEDDIGEIDKWTKIQAAATAAHAPAAELNRIADKIKDARKEYFARLTEDRWVQPNGKKNVLQKAQEQFSKLSWPNEKDDREFVLDQIDAQVKKVRDTKYDLRILERGKGLHELRRELRWILIEIQAVAGLVAPDDQSKCPFDPFAGDAVKRQTVQLDPLAARFLQFPAPSRDVKPCMVTRCLLHGILFLETRLGVIKDQAERAIGSSGTDLVPQALLAQALQTQELMNRSNVLQVLHDQLKECR